MIHVFGQQQIKTPICSLYKANISKYNCLSINFSKCVAAAHMEIGVLFSKITKTQHWSQAFLNMSLILLVNKCLKFGTTCAYINGLEERVFQSVCFLQSAFVNGGHVDLFALSPRNEPFPWNDWYPAWNEMTSFCLTLFFVKHCTSLLHQCR